MRRLFRATCKLTLTLALILLTLELATRFFSSRPPLITERDTRIGRRYRRSMRLPVYNKEAKRTVLLRTNSAGFRGPEYARPKPTTVYRVAILGDSFVAAEGLPEDETLTGRLEQLLNAEQTDHRYEVMNFGVSGSSTGQQLALYRELVNDFEPDVLLIGFGPGSDVVDNSAELASNPIFRFALDDQGELRELPPSDGRVGASRQLNRWSHFYVWQKRKTNLFFKRFRKAAARRLSDREQIYRTQETAEFQRAWRVTEAILAALQQETRRRGTRLLVASIPTDQQVYPDRFQDMLRHADNPANYSPHHPDRRLGEICDRLQVPCLSLVEDFRRRTPSANSRAQAEHLFFGGAGHLNGAGHLAVAENLKRFVLDHAKGQKSQRE